MTSKNKILALVVSTAIFGVTAADSAMARCSSGEIANFLCNTGAISQSDANHADQLNNDLGHPAEAIGQAGVEALGAVLGF
jgi:hypothetical protein